MFQQIPHGTLEFTVVHEAKIEPLNKYFGDLVYTDQQTRNSVERYISEGRLPEEYRLPELAHFREESLALAEFYGESEEKGWEPVIVFIPRKLSEQQWNGLFSGQRFEDGLEIQGSMNGWSRADVLKDTYPNPETEDALWDLAVVSSSDGPALTNISPNGKAGPNLHSNISELSKLSPVAGSEASYLVRQMSPTFETYLALQLSSIPSSSLVDTGDSFTIGREIFYHNGEIYSSYFSWDQASRKIVTGVMPVDIFDWNIGVRPSRRAGELLLPPF
jgi:hypothetical protein